MPSLNEIRYKLIEAGCTALGVARAQLGPHAASLAASLNKELGLSLEKTAAVLRQTAGLAETSGPNTVGDGVLPLQPGYRAQKLKAMSA